MTKILEFDSNLIEGDIARDFINLFPHLATRFKQRKTFDEYFYEPTEIDLKIEDIEAINLLGFSVTIGYDCILIK